MYVSPNLRVVIRLNKTQQKSRFKIEAEDRSNISCLWDDERFDQFSKPNIRNSYSNLEIY